MREIHALHTTHTYTHRFVLALRKSCLCLHNEEEQEVNPFSIKMLHLCVVKIRAARKDTREIAHTHTHRSVATEKKLWLRTFADFSEGPSCRIAHVVDYCTGTNNICTCIIPYRYAPATRSCQLRVLRVLHVSLSVAFKEYCHWTGL